MSGALPSNNQQEVNKRKYRDIVELEGALGIDRDYIPLEEEKKNNDNPPGYNMKASLPVAERLSNPNGPPVDGMEYLLMVRNDAKSLPNVVRKQPPPTQNIIYESSPLPSASSKRISHYVSLLHNNSYSEPKTNDNIDAEWQCNLLTKFKQQKESFHNHLRNFEANEIETDFPLKGKEKSFFTNQTDGKFKTPTPKLLAQLKYPHLIILLRYFANSESFSSGLGPELISSEQSQWLYSLLLRLDDLLEADTVALLRDLARRCLELRNNDLTRKFSSEVIEEHIKYCNTIITLVAYHFGQRDLLM
ncbi:hypothetical protein K502DRAFT_343286 [Neoconidiobolus thromboides FSU 785]|nr:hypothetical protein K502DRAFT_343286 [Neoconidiobolus thromboides FSU 785]